MTNTDVNEENSAINFRKIMQRFLVPSCVVTLYYLLKNRAMVSTKAEVEISSYLQLGRKVTVSSFTKIKATDGPLNIGKETGFATGCFIASSIKGITIGDYCIFGPNVTITSSNYRYDSLDIPYKNQGIVSKGITIGNNVWVGGGTTILDGSSIGDNAIVVANSLINRRFPGNCIIQGNPAKIILKRG